MGPCMASLGPIVVSLFFVAVTLVGQDPGDIPAEVRDAAKARWKDLRGLVPLKSPCLSSIPGESRVYRAEVFNPKSAIAGRPMLVHAIVVVGQKHIFIQDDASAAEALSIGSRQVRGVSDGVSRIEAFVELRGYRFMIGKEDCKAEGFPEGDWTLTLSHMNAEWIVSCPVLTDPYIEYVQSYEFRVNDDGSLKVKQGKVLSCKGGYK